MASGNDKSKKNQAKNKYAKTTRNAGNTKTTRNARNTKTTRNAKTTDNSLNDEIIILITFAIALILILSNFNLAGSFGKGIKWFMFGLFGVVEYVFPVIVAGTIIFLIVNREIVQVARIKTVGMYALTLIICGICQRIYNKPQTGSNIFDFFGKSAENKTGGGFFGGILCNILSPIGFLGTMVVLVILMIICIILITEKSFIKGIRNVKDNGTRMVKGAKEDYSAYKEHSAKMHELREKSEEEYRIKKEEEKSKAKIEKLEKKEKKIAEQKAREEYLANARMNKIVKGVTDDTFIPKRAEEQSDIDINEIFVDNNRNDEYSNDIYDPESSSRLRFVNPFDEEQDNPVNSSTKATGMATTAVTGSVAVGSSTGTVADNAKGSVTTTATSSTTAANTAEVHINQTEHKSHKPYKFPSISLLKRNQGKNGANLDREHKNTALSLQQTLQNFGVKVTITDISCGPTVTRYELQPEQGVKVSKIVSLSDDIKLNLAAADIRIEAPIPGKAAIGIEVPNKEAGSVCLRELIESDEFKSSTSPLSFGVGKDIGGKTIVADIAKMPHMLIAGATGSGKSVCINTIIMSILYKARPDEVKLIMVDPKVVELSVYNGIPHLLLPVVTEPKKAAGALNWAVNEMTDRYNKFATMGVRNIKGYNDAIAKKEVKEGEEIPEKLPHVLIIIDELADLMMVSPGEVEDAICRLAQLARAAGIHMVIATQRPSVNVITGLIKANVPSKIAFAVASGVDSRVILDSNGAEKLLGKGDMLYFPANLPKPLRVQGAFVSDEEVEAVVSFLKDNAGDVEYDESIANTAAVGGESVAVGNSGKSDDERDSLFAEAGRFVIESEKGSIGSLQRHFRIGFNRAGRIMDQLAASKVVGPEIGTKPRKVEMTLEEFEEFLKNNQ